MEAGWQSGRSKEALREAALASARRVVQGDDPKEPAMELWKLGMASTGSSLGAGLWQIWGRITDEWTHPRGDEERGAAWAREAAADLVEAIGNDEKERAFCDHWIYKRLDIVIE